MIEELEFPKSYDPVQIEKKWYSEWLAQNLFQAEESSKKPPFAMMLPPPNVTGSLHMGHAMYVIQDVLARWQRMEGKNVLWLPGIDHAGIATQWVVERKILKEEGKSRQELGREEFVQRVWSWKNKSGERIYEQMRHLGFSLDWSRSRFTMEDEYSKSVIEAFVRLYRDGFLYRDLRLINWCTRCQTALSDLEVESNEKMGSLWHIAYFVQGSNEQLIVATTRPETMFGDVAVAVHPQDERYAHLIGKSVVLPIVGRAIPVIQDEMVSMEFGTGAVKITPAHDFADFEVAKRHKLSPLSIITTDGRLNTETPNEYRELTIPDARKKVIAELEQSGHLIKTSNHTISLATCSRCDTALEPMLSRQWFVRTQELARNVISAVNRGETQFYPEGYQEEFFRWMENIRDWCVSRQLYWGHRIPVWYDQKESDQFYVAHNQEEAMIQAGHAKLVQDEDVLDTWFSSALWPFATLGWPTNTKELETFYPNSVLETGHDILFFWVARMLMLGTHLMGKVPFQKVLLHALVVDENGEKMSKVKGNVIDPLHLVFGAGVDDILGLSSVNSDDKKERDLAWNKFKKAFPAAASTYPKGFPAQGADALRFFLLVMGGQGRNIRLSIPRVEGYRHFLNKLWSAVRFFRLNVSEKDLSQVVLDNKEQLALPEKWILYRLNQVIDKVNYCFTNVEFSTAAQTIYQFFWYEVCDFYIERCKLVFQERIPSLEEDKKNIVAVLYTVIEQTLRLLHPMVPFITDELSTYLAPRGKTKVVSLMQEAFPKSHSNWDYVDSQKEMDIIQAALQLIRSILSSYQIRGENPIFVLKYSKQSTGVLLNQWKGLIEQMTKTQVELRGDFVPQGMCIAQIAEEFSVFFPNAERWMDVSFEKARLSKEIDKIQVEYEKILSRVNNPDFVRYAKAEVVEKDRQMLIVLKEKQAEINRHLQALE